MGAADNLVLAGISLQYSNVAQHINYYYCYKHHNFCNLFLYIRVKDQTICIEINLSQMSSWSFASLYQLVIFAGYKLQSLDQ